MNVAVDGRGRPVRLLLGPGQENDIVRGPELIDGLPTSHVIADKGYDAREFVAAIRAAGAEPVIPPRSCQSDRRNVDWRLYRERNLAERFLNRLEQCRRVATRYEKTARNYLAFVQLAAARLMLRPNVNTP